MIPVLDLNDDRHIGSVVMWPTVCVGKYIKRRGPYKAICHFLTDFEMDLIHTEYPYISGSWYSGTLGPS